MKTYSLAIDTIIIFGTVAMWGTIEWLDDLVFVHFCVDEVF